MHHESKHHVIIGHINDTIDGWMSSYELGNLTMNRRLSALKVFLWISDKPVYSRFGYFRCLNPFTSQIKWVEHRRFMAASTLMVKYSPFLMATSQNSRLHHHLVHDSTTYLPHQNPQITLFSELKNSVVSPGPSRPLTGPARGPAKGPPVSAGTVAPWWCLSTSTSPREVPRGRSLARWPGMKVTGKWVPGNDENSQLVHGCVCIYIYIYILYIYRDIDIDR